MTPRQFYSERSRDRIQQVARDAGTTFNNFQQIALAGGSVGKVLAARLAEASGGEMTELEILYPDRFNESAAGNSAGCPPVATTNAKRLINNSQ